MDAYQGLVHISIPLRTVCDRILRQPRGEPLFGTTSAAGRADLPLLDRSFQDVNEWLPDAYFASSPQVAVSGWPPRDPVVYCFAADRKEDLWPLYIGQTKSLSWRTRSHLTNDVGIVHGLKAFEWRGYHIRMVLWPLRCACHLDAVETALIDIVKPIFNRAKGPWSGSWDCTCEEKI